jgi:hypothetical protein
MKTKIVLLSLLLICLKGYSQKVELNQNCKVSYSYITYTKGDGRAIESLLLKTLGLMQSKDFSKEECLIFNGKEVTHKGIDLEGKNYSKMIFKLGTMKTIISNDGKEVTLEGIGYYLKAVKKYRITIFEPFKIKRFEIFGPIGEPDELIHYFSL